MFKILSDPCFGFSGDDFDKDELEEAADIHEIPVVFAKFVYDAKITKRVPPIKVEP